MFSDRKTDGTFSVRPKSALSGIVGARSPQCTFSAVLSPLPLSDSILDAAPARHTRATHRKWQCPASQGGHSFFAHKTFKDFAATFFSRRHGSEELPNCQKV